MLEINQSVSISEDEVELLAIRAQGSGGQNVNKLSSAIHLRFDINQSSLPEDYKQRLIELRDRRITKEGILIIKSQKFRTQEKNKLDAIDRLLEVIRSVSKVKKKRRPSKPSKNSQKKRMDNKNHRGKIKAMRGKVFD